MHYNAPRRGYGRASSKGIWPQSSFFKEHLPINNPQLKFWGVQLIQRAREKEIKMIVGKTMILLTETGNRRDKFAMEDYFILNIMRFISCLVEMNSIYESQAQERGQVIDYY